MSSPLVQRLTDELGIPLLSPENQQDILQSEGTLCLFFTEDPKRFPESNDVAVVLPELLSAFSGDFTAAVVGQDIEKQLQREYGFRVWPALVFLRNGKYLGSIEKIRDWSEYMDDIPQILARTGGRSPGIGVAVKHENTHSQTPK